MSEDLTKAQQILMWELFAAGGERLNKDIVPAPDAKDRKALVAKGLIETVAAGRTFLIRLKDDRGWRWIADSDPFPIAVGEKRITAERRLLQSLIRGFKRYAGEQGSTIQQLFRANRKKTDQPKADVVSSDRAGAVHAVAENPPSLIESAIRSAFFEIAGRPARDGVRLRKLRERLNDISRSDLDAALLQMRKSGRANLMNLDNPRDIEAEGGAALKAGEQTFHILWIDP